MAVTKKLNIRQLLKKNINKSKVFQNLAYGAAKKKIEGLKKETLREFNQHPVTKELEKGTSGMNSSLLGGRGNFFGFLGFHQGQQPVEIIRDIFEDHIKLRSRKPKLKKVSATSFTWEFDISVPSKTEIYAVTPMTWSSRSWVKGVERGVTNYTKTVFMESPQSRSGVALQSKQNVNFITFSPTPYITSLLDKLKKKLK
jgi:hypothetical protein